MQSAIRKDFCLPILSVICHKKVLTYGSTECSICACGFQASEFWGGHTVEGCVLLSSAADCRGTLIYGLSVLGTEEGHSYIVEVWQWGLWLQVCRW